MSAAAQRRVQSNEACLHILELPAQLLAQILKHLDQQDRHKLAALTCSAFSTAAAVATDDITVNLSRSAASKLTALPEWLQKHGHEAAVESITVRSAGRCCLLLPLQHLTALHKLDLKRTSIAWTAEAAADGGLRHKAVVLPPELSALTHLSVQYMVVEVAALPAFTRLQHLNLSTSRWDLRPEGFDSSSNVKAFAAALPKLLQLTFLQLSQSFTDDTSLAGLQQLSSLQHLSITGGSCTAASFQALPKYLTHLQYEGDLVEPSSITFSTDSTPGIAQLTALRELRIGRAQALHPAILGALTALSKFTVSTCNTVQTAGLSALSGLTQLQYLGLFDHTTDPAHPLPTAADFAALTASNQLTMLDVGLVSKECYAEIFPAGRSRPNLRELYASIGLLWDVATVKALVACCPGLQHLDLRRTVPGEVGVLAPDLEGNSEEYSMGYLQDLTQLTCLRLLVAGEDFSPPLWIALCQLQTLQDLALSGMSWADFEGVVRLTELRQLTKLVVKEPGAHVAFHLNLTNQAPAGSPSDVWRQLPSRALRVAMAHLQECAGQGPAMAQALKLVAQISTHVVLELHNKQQEQEGMQQQLAEMQAQLKVQRQQLEQQLQLQLDVADLQAQLHMLMQQQQQQH